MPLQATSGAASYDAFGGGAAAVPNYIEDVFSTWLYTGNGSTQTINNGIDLSGKGGLVWLKARSLTQVHLLTDTARGSNFVLQSDRTDAQINTGAAYISSFNNNGFSLGSSASQINETYASWTFREQPKFFDVVTWTGNGTDRTLTSALGSEPGCIIVKRTNSTSDWWVYHRGVDASVPQNFGLYLNTTAARYSGAEVEPSGSTGSFFVRSGTTNVSGGTYVAYLFAHNAGGFGLTGTDNVISCGSYTGNGSSTGPVVTLGYEAQWFMVKRASGGTADWLVYNNMTGAGSNNTVKLQPNTSNPEDTMGEPIGFTATGFQPLGADSEINANGSTYIYIAIRRGPMKVPTTGTSVFEPVAYTGTGTGTINTLPANFPVDMMISRRRDASNSNFTSTRLIGNVQYLATESTAGVVSLGSNNGTNNTVGFASNVGVGVTGDWNSGVSRIAECIRRAPGFFDVVCYTGNGTSGRALNHNLGVTPEMLIVKSRFIDGVNERAFAMRGTGLINNETCFMNSTAAQTNSFDVWGGGAIGTSSLFYVGADAASNTSGGTYVAYLFASCPGVSFVGNYTGTGATQVVNCGFTGGARFVLVKSLNASGAWYVWDSARGIVAGNDPYLLLNSTAAEVTNTDWVDTAATGFELSNAGGNLANSSGVTYIFWAIA
jgi:hypothetical protein